MALGGGTFVTQNKILPGAYINFVSLASASATLSDRGTVTMPLMLDWGNESGVFEVTNGDFQKSTMKLFGYAYTDDKMKALRKRYFDSFNEKAFGGNVQDYLTKTNSIPGVGSTKVTRVWNSDISPASMIPSVKVKSWYESTINTLSGDAADWLRTVYTAAAEKKLTTGGTVLLTILNSDYGIASSTLLETVQNTIDPPENAGDGYGLAPIGHVVSVKSADAVQVQVKTTLTFDSGYSWSNLQNSINTAISDYLLELRKSWADTAFLVVRVSQIETRLLSIKGIVDIDNTRINGTAENLTLGRYEVPMFGGASA